MILSGIICSMQYDVPKLPINDYRHVIEELIEKNPLVIINVIFMLRRVKHMQRLDPLALYYYLFITCSLRLLFSLSSIILLSGSI